MGTQLLTLCIKVFFCRICDVTLSSLRTVIMVKGKAVIAALTAFVEGLIWFLVVREALTFVSNNFIDTLSIALAYAIGYAIGTYLGSTLASKFVQGLVQVQVVTSSKDDDVIKKIQDAGYAITVVTSNATTFSGEKYLLFAEIKQNKLSHFKELVHTLDEKSFVMVSETKYVFNGFIKQ